MRSRRHKRFHQGIDHRPKSTDWSGIVKLFAVVGGVVTLAKGITVDPGPSSIAPVQRPPPPGPSPSWPVYAFGGAAAAPFIYHGAKGIYNRLEAVALPAAQPPPSPHQPQLISSTALMSKAPIGDAADDLAQQFVATLEESLRRLFPNYSSSTAPAWSPPADSQLQRIAPHPSVGAIIGKRGSGKSAFGYRMLELQRDRVACYVVGPSSLRKHLPGWIGIVQDVADVPSNAVVLVDEA